MNVFERLFCFPSFNLIQFLFAITLLQFWWIAVWGLAYMAMEVVAGKNKSIEFWIYIGLLVAVTAIVHTNPILLEKL